MQQALGAGLAGLFSVVVRPQTYLNILYLLLSFPLGIAYFVFLVTGLSVGFGLLIIWVGVPILVAVLAGSWALCQLERALANGLLREDIPPLQARSPARASLARDGGELTTGERLFVNGWRRFKAHLSDRVTWTGMLYLGVRFPLGIAAFVLVVVLLSVSLAFLAAPAYYWAGDGADLGVWRIDELWEALVLTAIGVPLTLISLHVLNGAAYLSGKVARVMLARLG